MFPTDDLTKHEKSIQDAYLSIHEANPGGDAPDADVTKMVRQAVYDIRYKARKEDIPLERAYSAYMGHTSMGPKARAMVKAKLFGETVEEEVITEKKVKSTQPEKTETKKDGKSAKLEKYLKNRRTKFKFDRKIDKAALRGRFKLPLISKKVKRTICELGPYNNILTIEAYTRSKPFAQ